MINKKTIVCAEVQNTNYLLTFIGVVSDIIDSELTLDSCVIGYKHPNFGDYIYYQIDNSEPIVENINLAGLNPVNVEQYELYLDVLKTKPISLKAFKLKMLKHINMVEQEQEQEPDITAID